MPAASATRSHQTYQPEARRLRRKSLATRSAITMRIAERIRNLLRLLEIFVVIKRVLNVRSKTLNSIKHLYISS